ncbi:IQ domain-containing protein K isoform X2 [Perognathus longimembris pacificus]|uniref:IQ domain-containing protein K isoform X2 n=1 Tax=Perognathus longimembris pacificus TaxID=214514 RepID=UPI002019E3CF|nr:IQ domain-containing protein K isoform X2 [Perognathus longimembris pacificus]
METAPMAAPRPGTARSVSREEPSGSAEPSVSAPTPPASLEQPVPPGQVAEPPPPPRDRSLWEQICEGSPKEYLENFIFPILLSGMVSLLHQAKKEKCFERKRTKFIACDYLTEWLYNHNPKRTGETFTEFFSIPFVEEWLKNHPRPPIPLSLLLTEEEAALSIQAFWRAYLVRCDPEIQELRQWQKKLHEDKYIRQRVQMLWAKQEQKVKCKMEDEEVQDATMPSP